jgi:hypothetical protein
VMLLSWFCCRKWSGRVCIAQKRYVIRDILVLVLVVEPYSLSHTHTHSLSQSSQTSTIFVEKYINAYDIKLVLLETTIMIHVLVAYYLVL